MHYQHAFHAGNFADVFKHVLLCGLLAALRRKSAPWCYLETHAGAGLYDLGSGNAAKTGEWREGIGRLLEKDDAPEPVAAYLQIVRSMEDPGDKLPYPGSPMIARSFAGPQDSLVLCEKVPHIARLLKERMGRQGRIAVHERDGYEAHALLPPQEKRGLVLLDPPFERTDELDAVAEFLENALARFANGMYAAWYAVKNEHVASRFRRRAARTLARPVLNIDFSVSAPSEGLLRNCSMLLVNPPFRFERDIVPALDYLVQELGQGPGAGFEIQWLRKE